MSPFSLLNVRRPVLFQAALQNATGAHLRALRDEAITLDPRRRELLEVELARRKAAEYLSWTALLIVLVFGGGTLIFLDHVIARS